MEGVCFQAENGKEIKSGRHWELKEWIGAKERQELKTAPNLPNSGRRWEYNEWTGAKSSQEPMLPANNISNSKYLIRAELRKFFGIEPKCIGSCDLCKLSKKERMQIHSF